MISFNIGMVDTFWVELLEGYEVWKQEKIEEEKQE